MLSPRVMPFLLSVCRHAVVQVRLDADDLEL